MTINYSGYQDVNHYANAAALAAVTTSTLYNGYEAVVTGIGKFYLNKDSTATVDNTTVISALNGGRWLINVTNPGLILNSSNQIDGSQLINVGKIGLDDGTAALPSLYFKDNVNLGSYRVGADTLGFTTNGVLRFSISTTAITSTLPVLAPAGAVTAPAYAFSTDVNSGLYSIADNSVGLATNGVLRLTVDTAAITSTLPITAPAGTVSAPAYGFVGELDCGFYLIGAGNVGLAINGANLISYAASSVTYANDCAVVMGGRFQLKKGSDVASANDITLGSDGNFFNITGTTTINTIAGTGWAVGSEVTLVFNASLTVADNQAGEGISLNLAAGANFSAQAGDTLTLIFDSTIWQEKCRSVNHA